MKPPEILVPDAQDPAAQPRLWTIWVTNNYDHTDHAVTDEEMTSGNGEYAAVCGTVVFPPSLLFPPGWRCVRCVTFLEARRQRHGARQHGRSHRQRGWLERVLRLGHR